jgi:hypothetical protein
MVEFSVTACWDGSNIYYTYDYVNRLYNSIKRNTKIPFEFILYTGPLAAQNASLSLLNKEVVVICTPFPYWWSGLLSWSKNPPGVTTKNILYMDLDQVIVGCLDPIINFPSEQAYMKDYPSDCCPVGKENDGNATISLIRNNSGYKVYDEWCRCGNPTWNPAEAPPNRLLPLAAQGIVNDLKIPHDVFPESWVQSYKLAVLKYGLHPDCISVSFHGKPKPHQCMHESFVKENWI